MTTPYRYLVASADGAAADLVEELCTWHDRMVAHLRRHGASAPCRLRRPGRLPARTRARPLDAGAAGFRVGHRAADLPPAARGGRAWLAARSCSLVRPGPSATWSPRRGWRTCSRPFPSATGSGVSGRVRSPSTWSRRCHASRSTCSSCGCRAMPPLWLLASTVMTWGIVPWIWRADARAERAEARAAVARVRTATRTPTCAVVFVASAGERTRLRHMPYLRATGTAAAVTAVGFITLDEIVDVLAEASGDLDGRAVRGGGRRRPATPPSDRRGIRARAVRSTAQLPRGHHTVQASTFRSTQ